MNDLKDHIDFSIIRYANCWEDVDFLLEALQSKPDERILTIASAGDNALSLLCTNPHSVLAVDISMPQLYLTQLKKAAFKYLSYNELLAFLGVTQYDDRKALYEKIKAGLDDDAVAYWDNNIEVLQEGVIYAGKFEQYFQFFKKYLLPLVHSKKTVLALLSPKNDSEQEAFFQQHWNTFRWKVLMRIFFSKYILGKYGRDPKFLKHVQVSPSTFIKEKAEQHLQTVYCQHNYMLHFILAGKYNAALPHYLRPENYECIRKNIDKLETKYADVMGIINNQDFDTYYLSNIFEYISAETFKETAIAWRDKIPTGARMAYWNLMAPRSFSAIDPEYYFYEKDMIPQAEKDKGFFYSRFLLESRR